MESPSDSEQAILKAWQTRDADLEEMFCELRPLPRMNSIEDDEREEADYYYERQGEHLFHTSWGVY